jgi:ring-1,2-phenylacetyl-CoA epoxidase subunit PaaD
MSSTRHALMALEAQVKEVLAFIEDPELPVTLVDLGVLRDVSVDEEEIVVRLLPTRLGCPGRAEMERRVYLAVRDVDQSRKIRIEWQVEIWRSTDVSASGLTVLQNFGCTLMQGRRNVECPYCHSTDIRRAGAFGASPCKTPFSCNECGSTFDALRSSLADYGSAPLNYEPDGVTEFPSVRRGPSLSGC